MKLILDVEVEEYAPAMNAALRVMAQHPDQKIGNGGVIGVTEGAKSFSVVRNQGSYTVRQA